MIVSVSPEPSRRKVNRAWREPAPAGSLIRMLTRARWPTKPNFGASTTVNTRSPSSRSPVIRLWTGAPISAATARVGTSWTCPSVIRIAPARRWRGISASARSRGLNNREPSTGALPTSPPPGPTRTTRSSIDASSSRVDLICSRAVSRLDARSPTFWLAVSSTITTPISVKGSRSSTTKAGLANATSNAEAANVRQAIPPARRKTPTAKAANTSTVNPTRNGTGMSGLQSSDNAFIDRAAPGLPGREPGRLCSCLLRHT